MISDSKESIQNRRLESVRFWEVRNLDQIPHDVFAILQLALLARA